MANPNHFAVLKDGVAAWNEWRAANPSIHPDLSGAELHGVSLVRANLQHADLRGASLKSCNVSLADCQNADFRNANLEHALFNSSNCESADFRGTNLKHAFFWRANVKSGKFEGANACDTILTQAECAFADFTNAICINADFARSDLNCARFINCNLQKADFSGSNLAVCTFEHVTGVNAVLAGARLRSVHAEHTIFSGVDATRADFSGAHFTGVDLTGGKLLSANLTAAKFDSVNLTQADLRLANRTDTQMYNCIVTNTRFQPVYGACTLIGICIFVLLAGFTEKPFRLTLLIVATTVGVALNTALLLLLGEVAKAVRGEPGRGMFSVPSLFLRYIYSNNFGGWGVYQLVLRLNSVFLLVVTGYRFGMLKGVLIYYAGYVLGKIHNEKLGVIKWGSLYIYPAFIAILIIYMLVDHFRLRYR